MTLTEKIEFYYITQTIPNFLRFEKNYKNKFYKKLLLVYYHFVIFPFILLSNKSYNHSYSE